MAGQDFATLTRHSGPGAPSLLDLAEAVVVDAHRRAHAPTDEPWSEPLAYSWLRYEDPKPVDRLLEGARKLRRRGVKFDAAAVDKACREAAESGFSN